MLYITLHLDLSYFSSHKEEVVGASAQAHLETNQQRATSSEYSYLTKISNHMDVNGSGLLEVFRSRLLEVCRSGFPDVYKSELLKVYEMDYLKSA
jgi:hypothetical protein